ncbi:MAG: hypothetical protein AAB426_11425 [Myxococcota bacterium]
MRIASLAMLVVALGATSRVRAQGTALQYTSAVYADAAGLALKAPEGVLCGPNDELIVADTGNGRLVRFAVRQGAATGGTEIRQALIGSPVRLQRDPEQAIIVLDRKARQLIRLTADGATAKAIAFAGVPTPSLVVPGAFRIDATGRLAVLDLASRRIVVTRADGQFVRQLALPGLGGAFTDVYLAKTGALYTVDAVTAQVYVSEDAVKPLHPFGLALKDVAGFPEYMTGNDSGSLLLVDNHGSGIVVLGPDGSYRGRQLRMGWIEGLVYYPGQICRTEDGSIVVADRGNNRVQIFHLE